LLAGCALGRQHGDRAAADTATTSTAGTWGYVGSRSIGALAARVASGHDGSAMDLDP